MRGRLLDFDFRTGKGEISGEDGQHYGFVDSEWRGLTRPQIGQVLDFQPHRRQAVSIYSLATPLAPVKPKSKIGTAVLAFFFGALGVHKFYLGKTGAGMAMLLVTVLGGILIIPAMVMAIIAWIECVTYLVITHEEFESRYLRGDRSWF